MVFAQPLLWQPLLWQPLLWQPSHVFETNAAPKKNDSWPSKHFKPTYGVWTT